MSHTLGEAIVECAVQRAVLSPMERKDDNHHDHASAPKSAVLYQALPFLAPKVPMYHR